MTRHRSNPILLINKIICSHSDTFEEEEKGKENNLTCSMCHHTSFPLFATAIKRCQGQSTSDPHLGHFSSPLCLPPPPPPPPPYHKPADTGHLSADQAFHRAWPLNWRPG